MKEETAEKYEIRKKKEAIELAKLEKEEAYHKAKNYLALLIVVLTIVYIVDEITSSMNSAMQPYAIFDLFKIKEVTDPAYDASIGKLTIMSAPIYLLLFLSPFYKSLADKYGRKLFLVLNTVGMGLGLLAVAIAPTPVTYVLGCAITQFFTPNDVQVMYIIECAPAEHRGKLCSITKAIALISCSLIGVLRSFVYDPANVLSWRYVYYLPIAIALLVGVSAYYFVRETPVYTAQRLAYLRSSDEERAAKAEEEKKARELEKENNKNSGGVKGAVKYIFSHSQTKNIAIAGLIFSASTAVTSYYTTILQAGVDTNVLTKGMLDNIYIIFPLVNGLITFIGGFINDKIGRKKSCLAFGVMAVVGLTLFVCGARFGFSQGLIGFAYGLFIGGLWSISDTLYLVLTAESTPTECRASVMGCMSLIGAIGTMLGTVLLVVGMNIVGSANLGIFTLVICSPLMSVALTLIMVKVEETLGVDLTTL